jgi:glycosyltransferase involved in cell wall biosynthesis
VASDGRPLDRSCGRRASDFAFGDVREPLGNGPMPLMKPRISIIMPVFNGRRFLDRAFHSVLRQCFPAWELLAVDDGSSDDSYSVLQHYAVADSRIRAFRLHQNRGPSAARNVALLQAGGDMITYLDCDDEYYPEYLSYVEHFRDRGDVLVFCYDVIDEAGVILGAGRVTTWDPSCVRCFLMHANVACPLGVAHRRELLERVGYFDESLFVLEDWDLWKRFALAGAEFLFLPLKSGIYHIRPDSQSRTGRTPTAAEAAQPELPDAIAAREGGRSPGQ